ncbi:MAG: FKBP-type peptidyl-prolyl cis-trans isomerase [Vicingaceae bacterium]
MKKLSLSVSVLFLTAALFSCGKGGNSEYPGFEKIEEGLYINFLSKNESAKAVEVGDIITMDMTYSTEDDSVLFETASNGQPVQMRADTAKYTGDISGAFLMMHEGDSAKLIVSADSFFMNTAGMQELPPFIDSASMLNFTVHISKIQTLEELQAEQSSKNAEMQAAEMQQLSEYLSSEGITASPTASGLIFISKKKGSGKQAEAGQTVKVNYEGMLLDGTYFDTSVEEVAKANGLYNEQRSYEPFEFTLGQGQVIKGWDEGIAMMKVGGKARLIIPSNIAYGANPRPGGPIKPFSTLIFDVELVDIVE